MPRKKYFAPEKVDGLIPELERVFLHIDQLRNRATALMPRKGAGGDSPADIAAAQMARSQIEFLLEAIEDDVDFIFSLGGVMKDLDAGLVDFPGHVKGEDVWLCWRRGEKKVRFWHSIDQGFDQRQLLGRADSHTTLH